MKLDDYRATRATALAVEASPPRATALTVEAPSSVKVYATRSEADLAGIEVAKRFHGRMVEAFDRLSKGSPAPPHEPARGRVRAVWSRASSYFRGYVVTVMISAPDRPWMDVGEFLAGTCWLLD